MDDHTLPKEITFPQPHLPVPAVTDYNTELPKQEALGSWREVRIMEAGYFRSANWPGSSINGHGSPWRLTPLGFEVADVSGFPAPGNTTEVILNITGAFATDSNFTYSKSAGGAFTVRTHDGIGNAGGDINIHAGSATDGNNDGGNIINTFGSKHGSGQGGSWSVLDEIGNTYLFAKHAAGGSGFQVVIGGGSSSLTSEKLTVVGNTNLLGAYGGVGYKIQKSGTSSYVAEFNPTFIYAKTDPALTNVFWLVFNQTDVSYITSGYNFGIGTDTPAQVLTVKGTIGILDTTSGKTAILTPVNITGSDKTFSLPNQTGIIVATPDPGANTIYMWDDTDNLPVNAALGAGLSYNHGTHTISSSITQYTDEMAQDAIGAMVDASITYNDSTPLLSITAAYQRKSLFDHYANAGNSTTTETDLYSDTLPAGQLATNGEKIEAQYGGTFVSSATATREVKLKFAGTTIFDTGALTLSLSSAWTMYVTLIRVSSSVVRYMISMTTEGAALAAYTAVGELTGLTLSGTNIVKITGQASGVGAATNDIVASMASVEWLAAA